MPEGRTSADRPSTPAVLRSAPGSRRLFGVPTSPGVGVGPVIASAGAGGGAAAPAHARGVVVAGDLSPADVAALDPEAVQAVAVAAGAPLSHASILARSMGIPAVTGLGPEVLEVPAGAVVLVDGDAGTVQLDPPSEAMEAAIGRQRGARRQRGEARRLAATPALTRDGCTVPVLANVGGPNEAAMAMSEGADGVGMLRTEFAFLGRSEPPSEEEQYQSYAQVARTIGDRPLIVRTLDLGADIPAWQAPAEPNPALGNRGLRFTLRAPELFDAQLRAVARLAADRPVRLKFPMVTTVDELHQARERLDAVTKASPGTTAGGLEVGITVEVPAAALTAEAFAPAVDFFSIGTNDLTQYTLAADRANAAVAGLADGLHPGVLRLIGEVTAAAERHQRPVVVVGELASDPLAIPVLLGLGVTHLSVRPNAVAEAKQAVRAVVIDQAQALAEAALAAPSAAAVRELAAQHRGR